MDSRRDLELQKMIMSKKCLDKMVMEDTIDNSLEKTVMDNIKDNSLERMDTDNIIDNSLEKMDMDSNKRISLVLIVKKTMMMRMTICHSLV